MGKFKFAHNATNENKSQFIMCVIHTRVFFRIFYGSKPSLVVTDPDIIAEVMIKKFDLFPNRTEVKGFEPKYFRKNISDLRGEEWKKVRNALTPTFTGLKLKKMVPFMNEIGIHLGGKFERILETSAQEFELKPMFRSCTMDIILNIVFGISVDSQVTERIKRKNIFVYILNLY